MEILDSFSIKNDLEIIIRFANKNDLDSIAKIESICFPKEEAASESSFKKRFEVFPENFLVAETKTDKKIIGFINGCTTDKPELPDILYADANLHDKNGDYQTIFGIDTLPEYRRQGVGEHLMKALIALTKKRGKKGLVLTCKDYLIHWYEKFGYKNKGVSNSCHGGAKWNDMLYLFSQ